MVMPGDNIKMVATPDPPWIAFIDGLRFAIRRRAKQVGARALLSKVLGQLLVN